MRQMRMALAAMGLLASTLGVGASALEAAEYDKQRRAAAWGLLSGRRERPASLRGCNRGSGAGLSRALAREAAKAKAVLAQYAHLPPASAYPTTYNAEPF